MGRPRITPEPRREVLVRLPTHLVDHLDAEAARRQISRNLIVTTAIETWLDVHGTL